MVNGMESFRTKFIDYPVYRGVDKTHRFGEMDNE
jgi:hypothetical protein